MITTTVTATRAESLQDAIQDAPDMFTLTALILQIPRVCDYATPEETELIKLAAAKQIELGELARLQRN